MVYIDADELGVEFRSARLFKKIREDRG